MERAGVAEVRARLAGDLGGRTLEVGCGTGLVYTRSQPKQRALLPDADLHDADRPARRSKRRGAISGSSPSNRSRPCEGCAS
jgi:hypothetical protein